MAEPSDSPKKAAQLLASSHVSPVGDRLMERVKNGDRAAFEELYTTYKKPILSYAHSWVQNRSVAEEITQDVFLKAYRHKDTYQATAKVSTWLWTIARNSCLDHLRKKKEVLLVESDSDENFVPGLRLEDVESPLSSAESALIENAEKKAVEACVQELTEIQREVLMLRTVSEMAYEDIASVVKASLSSIKSLLFRAKEKLLECIKKGGHAHG